jgi:hypothetical protein
VPSNNPPRGERFSQVYLARGEPVQDSARMRHRLGALIDSYPFDKTAGLGLYVQARLGIEADYISPQFLKTIELKDVLDIVTVAYDFLASKHVNPTRWAAAVERIFKEENVHYQVDDEGGVHFRFDKEFSHAVAATIAVLQSQKYANVLDAFQRGQQALSEVPPNGKAAIRGVFNAAEGLFRMMFPAPRLTVQFVEQHLRLLVQTIYSSDPAAVGASAKLISSFNDWIDAAHFYRHEDGKPDSVAQPPLGLAIYVISTGAAHLRWLAELDLQRTT